MLNLAAKLARLSLHSVASIQNEFYKRTWIIRNSWMVHASLTCASTVGPSIMPSLSALPRWISLSLLPSWLFSLVKAVLCKSSGVGITTCEKRLSIRLTNHFQHCRKHSSIKHSVMGEIDAGCSQLIQVLVCEQHLTQCFIAVGLLPRFLDCLDVLWFCNWWTKAIWSTKSPDQWGVVDEGVLPWKCKSIWMHTNLLEDHLIVMILIESILEVMKSLLHNYIMLNNVTKL